MYYFGNIPHLLHYNCNAKELTLSFHWFLHLFCEKFKEKKKAKYDDGDNEKKLRINKQQRSPCKCFYWLYRTLTSYKKLQSLNVL